MRRKEETYPVTFRLPVSLRDELVRISDAEDRSLANVVYIACKEYAERKGVRTDENESEAG